MLITLAQVIAAIESGGCGGSEAMRFEEVAFDRRRRTVAPIPWLAHVRKANLCNWVTGIAIGSASWGAYQIMGSSLYGDLGYTRSIAGFLASPVEQEALFHAFLAHKGIAFSIEDLRSDLTKRQLFALHYNGPDEVDHYADLICAEIARRDYSA